MKLLLIYTLRLLVIASTPETSELEIIATGFKEDGNAYVLLFSEGQKIKTDSKECYRQKAKITNSECQFSCGGLSSGSYAFIVFHDENFNGELDTNILGMPIEGVGNSNNHKGIPSFKKY